MQKTLISKRNALPSQIKTFLECSSDFLPRFFFVLKEAYWQNSWAVWRYFRIDIVYKLIANIDGIIVLIVVVD